MAFEAAFVTACLFFMHAQMRRKHGILSRDLDVLSARLEVTDKDLS